MIDLGQERARLSKELARLDGAIKGINLAKLMREAKAAKQAAGASGED